MDDYQYRPIYVIILSVNLIYQSTINMKKSIVIVVVIAVVILGLFVWIGASKPLDKTINNLQAQKSVALEKMQDAVLNGATLNIVIAADDYYQKNPTGVFEKDAASIAKVDNYIAGIKNERNIDVEYYVHSSKTNYVVKTRAKGASNFYCLDTTTESVKPTIIESTTDFMATSDCKGVELK